MTAPITSPLATRYAKALLRQAVAQNADSAVAMQMDLLQDMIASSDDFARLLRGVGSMRRGQVAIMQAIAEKSGFHMVLTHFLGLLAKKARLAELPMIITAYAAQNAARLGMVTAYVHSAKPLSGAQADALKTAIQGDGKNTIVLQAMVDPALIAGMTVQVQSVLVDGSVAGQLRRLENHLRRTA